MVMILTIFFHSPCGLALDPQGNIHVAAFASTIKVFTKGGVYVRIYGNAKVSIKGID